MGEKSFSARVADWSSRLDGRALPGDVTDRLKLATLDGVACMLSGVREPIGKTAVT